MSKFNNLKRAKANHSKWLSAGAKNVQKYNAKNGTNFAHDVATWGDIIDAAPDSVLSYLLTRDGALILKEDVPNIPLYDEYTSFSSFYTYVLTMVEKKFGTASVRKNISKDPYGFRGVENKQEIKEFARFVAKMALTRIENRQ